MYRQFRSSPLMRASRARASRSSVGIKDQLSAISTYSSSLYALDPCFPSPPIFEVMRVVSLSVLIVLSLLGVGALPSASGCNAEGTWCCDKNTVRTDISGLMCVYTHLYFIILIPRSSGKGCTPTSIIGIGGNECQGQTVCCDKTDEVRILFSSFPLC